MTTEGTARAASSSPVSLSVVIPTVGRVSLQALLETLVRSAAHTGLGLPPIYVVDDRTGEQTPLDLSTVGSGTATLLASGGRGPAAARNVGWRETASEWVAFLDDDVLVAPDWLADLRVDLQQAASIAGVQGQVSVPLPPERRPTDWERGTAGLETARWITADMAYRRSVLMLVGGFDERFPRAFREDADLALRVLDTGYELVKGTRQITHPVRPAGWWASLHQQRGNADDVLMDRLHRRGWRLRAEAPLGRRPLHLLTTALAVTVPVAWLLRRRVILAAACAGWAALTADFGWRRVAPGPRDRAEVLKMVTTSVLIPPAASWFWGRAMTRRWSAAPTWGRRPGAVLLDRDGTLIRDVPYNGDPGLVEAMPGAAAAVRRLRLAGIPIAVITNQSGVGRGLLSAADVEAVNTRVEELLGPFDAWLVCPHSEADACGCRKPMPGMVQQAAQRLRVSPQSCVVIGDIGADMGCARAAGARGILVPTSDTFASEVTAAPQHAATLGEAVDLVLSGRY